MKTFCGEDGNYADMPLSSILDRMTDDWIDNDITGANISELRDACRKLLATVHNSDEAAKCHNKELARLWTEIDLLKEQRQKGRDLVRKYDAEVQRLKAEIGKLNQDLGTIYAIAHGIGFLDDTEQRARQLRRIMEIAMELLVDAEEDK